jgi:hypothetical protein
MGISLPAGVPPRLDCRVTTRQGESPHFPIWNGEKANQSFLSDFPKVVTKETLEVRELAGGVPALGSWNVAKACLSVRSVA